MRTSGWGESVTRFWVKGRFSQFPPGAPQLPRDKTPPPTQSKEKKKKTAKRLKWGVDAPNHSFGRCAGRVFVFYGTFGKGWAMGSFWVSPPHSRDKETFEGGKA